jgi:hypothetical protein
MNGDHVLVIPPIVPAGTSMVIAMVHDGTVLYVYINGKEVLGHG